MGWISSCFAQKPERRSTRSARGCLRVGRATAAAKEGRRTRGETGLGGIVLRAPALRGFGGWPRSRERQRVPVLSRRFARLRLPPKRAEAWPAWAEACRRFHQGKVFLVPPAQIFRCVCPQRR